MAKGVRRTSSASWGPARTVHGGRAAARRRPHPGHRHPGPAAPRLRTGASSPTTSAYTAGGRHAGDRRAAHRRRRRIHRRRNTACCMGALAALTRGAHAPGTVLDSYLLRALATAGWAPSFTDCARCGAAGPAPGRSTSPLGGVVCHDCRPAGLDRRRPRRPSPCWPRCSPVTGQRWTRADSPARREAAGLVASYLQWHLERAVKSLKHRGAMYEQSLQDHRQARARRPRPHRRRRVPMPDIQPELIPQHVAIVMDGNGRWANQRGLPRTEGHRAGEAALLDVMAGAVRDGHQVRLGVRLLHRELEAQPRGGALPDGLLPRRAAPPARYPQRLGRADPLGRPPSRGSGARWSTNSRTPRSSPRHNHDLQLTMCVNYGGRAEIADAVRAIAERGRRRDAEALAGSPRRRCQSYLDEPDMPDVDLFLRTSGEQRTLQFPALAVRLCRDGLHGRALARR